MLFSATYSYEVMEVAFKIVKNPFVLRLKPEEQILVNIRQYFIYCSNPGQKYDAIEQIYAHLTIGQTIIFCATRVSARQLAARMTDQRHSVRELKGALAHKQRALDIREFRQGLFRVLISANVSVRGKLNRIEITILFYSSLIVF